MFVDHPSYHRPGNLYGDKFGAFGDNQVRSLLVVTLKLLFDLFKFCQKLIEFYISCSSDTHSFAMLHVRLLWFLNWEDIFTDRIACLL